MARGHDRESHVQARPACILWSLFRAPTASHLCGVVDVHHPPVRKRFGLPVCTRENSKQRNNGSWVNPIVLTDVPVLQYDSSYPAVDHTPLSRWGSCRLILAIARRYRLARGPETKHDIVLGEKAK